MDEESYIYKEKLNVRNYYSFSNMFDFMEYVFLKD